jgi:ubiquinol-cytochrome c reductase cytochrome b subunit
LTGLDHADVPEPHPEPGRATMGAPVRLWRWFDRRTEADALLRASLDEPIPGGARFAYVFGSALVFLFMSQVVTGLCLALYYVPSPLTAHVTLAYIVKEVAAGAFLRSLHSYGSSAMVVVLVLHFLQTLLYGSYKGRRELLWIAGCVLSLLILGMTFTGYLLRWDLQAYFAGSVGTSLAGDIPLVGGWLMRLLRGGEMVGALTLSRFYLLHVFILPASIFLFIAMHVFLFRKAGAAGPVTEDPVRPHLPAETFYPRQVIIDMAFVLVVMGVLGMLAHFVPVELGPVADPSNSNYLPRPEWYYLPFFEWLKFWDGAKTVIGVVVIPVVLIVLVFLLPFLDRSLERRPWKRPIPVGSVLFVLIGLIGLGLQSRLNDSRDPTTAAQIAQQNLAEDRYFHAPFQPYSGPSPSGSATPATASGAAAQGKTVFDGQGGCSHCHGTGGTGGIGPALTHITDTIKPPQLTALLKEPNAKMKAGGMVPLTLSAADLTALVSYVSSLSGTPPAAAALPTPGSSSPGSTETKPATAAGSPSAASAAAPPASGSPSPAAAKPEPAAAGPSTPSTGRSGGSATAAHGKAVFDSQRCSGCHGATGRGGVGPALTHISSQYPPAQLTALLNAPNAKMKAGGMVPLTLSAADLTALVSYVSSLSGTPAPAAAIPTPGSSSSVSTPAKPAPPSAPTPAPATPASGSAGSSPPPQTGAATAPAAGQAAGPSDQRGEAIFKAQGCSACHGAGAVGTSRAPSLTKFSKTITAAALASLLETPNHAMQAGGMRATKLAAADMSALVAYLQHLGASATAPPTAAVPSPGQSAATVSPPAANPAATAAPQRAMSQLESQGQAIFAAHGCGSCHGRDGVGGTAAAPALAGTGRNFPPESLTAMLHRPTIPMRTGGMPPLSISDGELKALVAYVSYISSSTTTSRPVLK